MKETSSVTAKTRITSKPKATLESTAKETPKMEASKESQALHKLQGDVERAFSLVQEIRTSLQTALKDLD